MESIYFSSTIYVDCKWGIFNLSVLAAWSDSAKNFLYVPRDPIPVEAAHSISEAGYLLSWGLASSRDLNRDLNQKETKIYESISWV